MSLILQISFQALVYKTGWHNRNPIEKQDDLFANKS